MTRRAPENAGPGPAFVLLDAERVPVLANAEALRVLAPKGVPAAKGELATLLADALTTALPAGGVPPEGVVVSLLSGRRRYNCRMFALAPVATSEAAYLLMIERAGAVGGDHTNVVERYSLTLREAELLRYLVTGLTNKEIGERMQISPNTVKAFLKLMMTKMGVSTRAAVVGRALENNGNALPHAAGH